MDFLNVYLAEIDKELHAIALPKGPVNLYEPFRYMLDLGGKRIRPALTLMGHTLFNTDHKKAMPAALCIELFHNFSLIHDDIMDKAPLRRGKPTVHTKWNETIGILSGDVMLVNTYKMLADHYSGDVLSQLMKIYTATAIEVCEGQQMDMDFESRNDVTVEQYEQMISLKTSVLLGCALKMGAITGGATNGDANHLYEFGKNIGIAFQLRDDYLDVFGDPAKTGKQPGGDILAGKKTFLMIECRSLANAVDKQKLDALIQTNANNKVNATLELLKKYKVDELTQAEVTRFQTLAMEHLANVQVANEKKKSLVALADYLLNREH
ncbi:MAG TPA: polyprenyl synthetase family protein [Flavobacteriales bacterium]|nr:polyprenyl synthetase family protein [Flavobacteriales bacterium]